MKVYVLFSQVGAESDTFLGVYSSQANAFAAFDVFEEDPRYKKNLENCKPLIIQCEFDKFFDFEIQV